MAPAIALQHVDLINAGRPVHNNNKWLEIETGNEFKAEGTMRQCWGRSDNGPHKIYKWYFSQGARSTENALMNVILKGLVSAAGPN